MVNLIISLENKMIREKDRDEGDRMKNILGVVAVITVVTAIVLITFSSPASASLIERTFTSTGGVINYTGGFAKGGDPEDEDAKNILLVYNWKDRDESGGEKITFFNLTNGGSFADVWVEGPYTKAGRQFSGYDLDTDLVPAGDEWDAEGKKTGGYYKVWDKDGNGGWFQIGKHDFKLELEKKKVQEGENFSLKIKSNDRKQGIMKLTIEDYDGYSITNANRTDIYKIGVEYGGAKGRDFIKFVNAPVKGISLENESIFDTTALKMEAGKYKIILEDNATSAEVKVSIEVEERYLEVEYDEEVVMGGDIVIILKSSFYEEQATVTIEDIPEEDGILQVTLDEEGKKKVKIPTEDLDYGTHKITIEVSDMKETVYVSIKRGRSSLEVPDNATVGNIVRMEGSSNFGDLAVLVIDDVFKGDARISGDKFEWGWDTSGELAGYREIEVFIVDAHDYSVGDLVSDEWQKKEGVDASEGIFLLLPMFSMTVPEDITEGDDAVIRGEATGADRVYIIVINHKGEVMFPSNGIVRATPVEEGAWVEKIADLDNGRYVVISLDRGRDEETNAIDNGEWAAGDGSKTMEQRVAILLDAITSAGSDDMFELAYFSVSTPQVGLDLPETAEVDDELRVTAETNIKDGEKAFVSLSFNTNIIKTISTLIEDGSVHTSINTSGLQPGRYNVAVYIGGRTSDEKEVILVEKTVEEGEESIPQNESLTEPEAAAEVNESVDGGNENQEEQKEQEIPVNMWDVLIALAMATLVSVGLKRRRR